MQISGVGVNNADQWGVHNADQWGVNNAVNSLLCLLHKGKQIF